MEILELKNILSIKEKIKNGLSIKRSEKIWFQNIEGVRKAGIKYFMFDEELDEYIKCKTSVLYFAENYFKIIKEDRSLSLVSLLDYQKDAIKHFQENQFSIFLSSRQMGISLTLSICLLHELLFSKNKNTVLISNKESKKMINKIKNAYKNLPFFLKIGVHKWSEKNLIFENGCSLSIFNSSTRYVKEIDNFILTDFAYIPSAERIYQNIFSTLRPDSKITINSSPNGYNFFCKLVEDSERKDGDPMKNQFKTMRIYYWQIPGRDQKWVDEQIKIIGKKLFDQEYELSFFQR